MERGQAEYAEFARNAQDLESFVRQLFHVFVDGPLMTDEQRRLAASRIAQATVDAHCTMAHLAYTAVSRERRAKGLPMGS
jgi:hypothetical protein